MLQIEYWNPWVRESVGCSTLFIGSYESLMTVIVMYVWLRLARSAKKWAELELVLAYIYYINNSELFMVN